MSGTMKKEQIHAMTEAAVMVAMATVLSLIKFTKLPFGGSVTLLSMFPIIIYSIRRGVGRGVFARVRLRRSPALT